MPDIPNSFLYNDATDVHALAGQIETAYSAMKDGPVAPAWSFAETKRNIAAIDFDTPVSLDAALQEAVHLMEHGDLRSASARCFGYFNPTAAWPAMASHGR